MTRQANAGPQRVPESPEPKGPKPSGGFDMEELYLEIRASLIRYASRYFKRSQEAEDVVQEAFVKVLAAQRKRAIDSPKSYLFTTTRNLSLRQLSKNDFKLTDELDQVLSEPELLTSKTLEEQMAAREHFELFCRAVRSLPQKCRRAFVLCRVYGYSQKEAAEYMGIGVKAVEGHLARATVRCVDYMDAETESGNKGSQEEGSHHG